MKLEFIYLLFITIIYSLTCLGTGGLLVKFLSKKTDSISPAAYLSSCFLMGQGILASIWLILSLAHLFTLPIILIFIGIGFALSIFLLPKQIPLLKKQLIYVWQDYKNDHWEWKIIIILSVLLCINWVTSIGRSVFGDASAIYFALPKVIAASHRLVPLPGFEGFMYIGLQGEMHFAALMALGSPDAAQLFSWPTLLAGVILLLALGRQAGLQRRGQWIAFLIVFTSSCVILFSGDGKADLFAASLGLAAYFWAMQAWKNKDSYSPWLIGLFAGFAVTAKFSYIPVLLPGIALIICWGYFEEIKNPLTRKKGISKLLITSAKIFSSFLLALIPHLIQNSIFFQNPIAPFGQSAVSQIWFNSETTKRIIFTYPLALTFGSYWAQYGDLSPLLLAFLPLGLVLKRPRPLSKSSLFVCTTAAMLGLIIWIISQPSVIAPRYIMPTLLVFVLLPSKAVEKLSEFKLRPQFLYYLILFSIVGTIFTSAVYFNNFVFFPETFGKYVVGTLTECDRGGENCEAMEAINNDAEPGRRVYLASYHRYWLRPDLIQCANSVIDQIPDSSADVYWMSIYQSGFNYLLIDQTTHSIPFLTELPSWLKLSSLYQGKDISVYRIITKNAPEKIIRECKQQKPGEWNIVTKGK